MRRHLVLVPGLLGWLLVTFVAVKATIWSSAEMFREGWWGSMPHRLVYMVPGFLAVLLAAVPVRWPRLGGWFLGTVGVTVVIFGRQFFSTRTGLEVGGTFVVAALVFIMEGWRLKKIEREKLKPFSLSRCSRLAFTLGLPLLAFLVMGILNL